MKRERRVKGIETTVTFDAHPTARVRVRTSQRNALTHSHRPARLQRWSFTLRRNGADMAGRKFLTVMSGVAMAAGVSLTTVPEAQAAPTATYVYAAGEFQCGPNNWIGRLVPENPPGGANFHYACTRHDACYSAGSRTNRLTCDTAFRTRMNNACAAAGKGATCRAIASTYYWAVRGAGRFYYKGSGLNN